MTTVTLPLHDLDDEHRDRMAWALSLLGDVGRDADGAIRLRFTTSEVASTNRQADINRLAMAALRQVRRVRP